MAEGAAEVEYTSLCDALERGACVAVIKQMVAGMTQAEVEERDEHGRFAAVCALKREPDVLGVILDTISREKIQKPDDRPGDLLDRALLEGGRDAVVLVAKRTQRVERDPLSIEISKIELLVRSQFVGDKEIVDAVTRVVPDALFGPDGPIDALSIALDARGDTDYLVEVILDRGPPMEERLHMYSSPLVYVSAAANKKDLAMVQRMHDSLPDISDGCGRKASVEQYSDAVGAAVSNERHAIAIIEYLLEKGGDDVLDACFPVILTYLKSGEAVRWVVTRCPDLLRRGLGGLYATSFLFYMLLAPEEVSDSLIEMMLEFVDDVSISRMVKGAEEKQVGELTNVVTGGWRRRLRRLHEEVPGTIEGMLGTMLLHAVREKQYGDVEYLLGLCTREDRVTRNEEGDTAYDVAVRDAEFPRDLLASMVAVAKNAYC